MRFHTILISPTFWGTGLHPSPQKSLGGGVLVTFQPPRNKQTHTAGRGAGQFGACYKSIESP